MGSGVSSIHSTTRARASKRSMGKSKVHEMVRGKPVDASDIITLEQAKEEICQLRQLIREVAEFRNSASSDSVGSKNARSSGGRFSAQRVVKAVVGAAPARGRAAICASVQKVKDYEHVVIEKPDEISALILSAIGQSVLFKNCVEGDLSVLAEAFAPVDFEKGAQVITQNEAGDDFYVVEEGILRCFVLYPGEAEEVEVRTPYVRGESFGELALMYNNPRAATLRADAACKLWSIKRGVVQAILTSRRAKKMQRRMELLSNVTIGDMNLQEKLSKSEMDQLAYALEDEVFQEGECIVLQGEIGNSFYILQSGEISVHKRSTVGGNLEADTEKGPQVTVLKPGSYFGERALMSDETRKATCIALTKTVCLSLGREDFLRMLGPFEDLMVKAAGLKTVSPPVRVEGSHHIDILPEDLEVIRSLGEGAFGNVKLVLHKPSGKAFALKCQGKVAIVENELQEHILEERRLLMVLDHPFILKLHDSFQDNRYIYFVLEALMGGEIYTHLRKAGNFDENATKIYTATVLCALGHMHDRDIAYRDLKPENLVLDDKGYIKMVDLGLAKVVPIGYTWTICGTPDYLAPEIILNEGHDQAVDFWALGVLIYEMLAGVTPFYAPDPMTTYENILAKSVQPPSSFSKSVRDIVRKLLKINKSKRLGKTAGGAKGVMKHKWFSGFDWEGLLKRQLKVPIDPKLKGPFDASHFNPPGPAKEESAPCPEWTPDF